MTIRNCFRLAGTSLLAVACLTAWCLRLFPSEKDAAYLFGHWIDITWELLIPGAALGLLLLDFSCFGKKGASGKS